MDDGAWLFDYGVSGWMRTPELNRQLPPHLRLFALYCGLQHHLIGGRRIVGGQRLFRALVRATRPQDFALRAHGFTVHLKLADPRLLHVPNELSPRNPNRRALERLLAPGDTFIDIGANHGTFSLIAARALGRKGKVVAIEPQPDLARLIGLSLRGGAECAFDVHQCACGDAAATAKLFVPRLNSGEAGLLPSLSARRHHDEVVVSVRTLDSLLDGTPQPGNVLMKLDVEGSEAAVLLGAQNLIRTRKPKLLVELNEGALSASGTQPADFLALLRGLGFASFAELDHDSRSSAGASAPAGLEGLQPLEALRFEPFRNVLVTP